MFVVLKPDRTIYIAARSYEAIEDAGMAVVDLQLPTPVLETDCPTLLRTSGGQDLELLNYRRLMYAFKPSRVVALLCECRAIRGGADSDLPPFQWDLPEPGKCKRLQNTTCKR